MEFNFREWNVPLIQEPNDLMKILQVHPFCEGNTRTTAVFIIKYLRTFEFNINDAVFAENSWCFRNSLVRANYKNFEKNIFEDTSLLEKSFYNYCTLEEQAIINILKVN